MNTMSPSTPRLNRRQMIKLLGGSLAMLGIGACTPAIAPAQPVGASSTMVQPQAGGVLRVAFSDLLAQLDPAMAVSLADISYAYAVFENLTIVDFSDPNYPVLPHLAESWESSEDGRIWTFHLRQGVQFHHGALFTAQDVVYTMTRIMDPALGSVGNSQLQIVERVEAVDDTTVRFVLHAPHVAFARVLGTVALQIVPHTYTSEQLATAPSGTGPFKLGEYTPGERLLLTRHEGYWDNPRPYLAEVHHLYITDTTAQIAALTSGTIEVISQVGVTNLPMVESDPTLKLLENPLGIYHLFAMRTDMEPFADVRVRQALKHAVDRNALRQVVWRERGTVGNDQPVPPVSPFWGGAAALDYDAEKAKALLAAAGYADGLTVPLAVAEVTPGIVDAAVALQEMVKAAGITINLERSPADGYWAEQYMQTPFFVSFWPGLADPDEILTFAYHSQGFFNESGWSTPAVDGLIEAARTATDPAQRKALYAEIQQQIATEGGVLIPYFAPQFMAMRNHIQGIAPFPVPFVRTAWLAQA